jgi:sodium/potassium-transporting ATPase subunit alpha
MLAIVYTRPGHLLFGTAPIGLRVWLFVLPCAAGLLVLDEIRKWVVRRLGRPSRPPVATKDTTRFAAEPG